MLQWLAGGALAVQAAWVILCLLRQDLPPLPREEGRVTNRRLITWIGVSAFVLLMIPAVICVSRNTLLWWVFIPLVCTVLVTAGCLPCIRWNEEGFTVRTFFGRTHECTWADVRSVGSPLGDSWIVTAKGRFFMDGTAVGSASFMAAAIHRGKAVKQGSAPFDIFRGHVQESGGMLAALVLMGFLGALLLGLGLNAMFTPVTEENTLPAVILAEGWENSGDHFDLFSGEDVYRVQYDERKMARRFKGLEAPMTLEARVRPGQERIRVYALTAPDGTALFTLAEVNRNSREVGVFLLALAALCAAMIVLTILVGRDPGKYPAWLRKMLFKPGALMWEEEYKQCNT